MSDVTQLLSPIDAGDPEVSEQLLPLVYAELLWLASGRMAHEKPGQTLQTTALVHEAWLRVEGEATPQFQNRAHFLRAAAPSM